MLSLTTLRSAAMAAIIVGGGAGFARAADILHAPAPPPLAPPHALDVESGFYLRGDIGVAVYDHKTIDTQPPIAGLRTVNSSVDASGLVGVGAGYAFNSWLRADATIEYRFFANHRHVDNAVGVPGGPFANKIDGKLDGFVGLVNGYIDLGTWHRVTPFIGAGVGFAHMNLTDTSDINLLTNGSVSGPDRSTTNFAWALHAGLGFNLSTNWKAELAYRYLSIGDVRSGTVQCTPGPCGGPYNVRIRDLASHDVKFGVRYLFADAAPSFAPGPLVRKY